MVYCNHVGRIIILLLMCNEGLGSQGSKLGREIGYGAQHSRPSHTEVYTCGWVD